METEEGRERVRRADERRERQYREVERDDAGQQPPEPSPPSGAVAAGDRRPEEAGHPMLDKFIEVENQADWQDGNPDDLFARSEDEAMGDDGPDTDMAMVQRAEFDVEVLSPCGAARGQR